MSNVKDVELLVHLLDKMEECVNNIKMLNYKFQKEVSEQCQTELNV